MRHVTLIISFIFAITGICSAQAPVIDKYPTATIYVIDQQTGQEVLAQNDAAVLFKNAFIDLVTNTRRAKLTIKSPGKKTFIITQADLSNGNAYELISQSKFLGQQVTNYTFSYNVDQNTLYYFDQNSQQWDAELVQGYNVVNLNNCLALGKFNEQEIANVPNDETQQGDDAYDDDNIAADTPPPALQDYEQPECPEDGYLWQPGYWAYNPGGGYYWVAGEWVAPPTVGLLWTPPYWGYEGSRYIFHRGYWGNDVGFYGGIDYGYGYTGTGFVGGAWSVGHFRYNSAVLRVGGRVHNVFVDRSVIRVGVRVKLSFNGPGGLKARPSEREQRVTRERHIRDNSQNPRAANNGHNGGGNNHNGNNGNNANNGKGHNGANGTGGNGHNGANGNGGNTHNGPARNNGNGNNHSAPGGNANNGSGNGPGGNPPRVPGNGPGGNAPRVPVNGSGGNAPRVPGNNPGGAKNGSPDKGGNKEKSEKAPKPEKQEKKGKDKKDK